MRNLRGSFVFLAACLAPLAVIAEEVTVGGRPLHIEVTGDFCALDRHHPFDRQLFDVVADVQRRHARLISFWADCKKLDLARAGRGDDLTPHVHILAQVSKENADPQPVDLPMDVFLAKMTALYSQALDRTDILVAVEEDIQKRLGDIFDAAGTPPGVEIGDIRMLGILAQDDVAIYLGAVEQQLIEGRQWLLGSIVAITQLNGLHVAVTVNAYDTSPQGFDRLRAQAHQIVASLVSRNPTVSQSDLWSWFESDDVRAAIRSTLIAVVVAVALVVFHRRRSRLKG